MADTPVRLLRILSLLQTRPTWTATELAERLEVSTRTIRNDVERLRALDYPVTATRGPTGSYRLGAGAKLPPLLLDNDEAIAVAIGLRAATGIVGIEDSSASALVKLDQVLPNHLRRKVTAIHRAVSTASENTGSNVDDPEIDVEVLTAVASAIRDSHEIRFDYRDAMFVVEPYRLVSWQRRWHLVGRDCRTSEWDTYRVDWLTPRMPTHRSFVPRPLADGDYTSFVLRNVSATGWAVHARITIDASADDVLSRINAAVGVVESVDETTSVLVTGADSVETIAVYIGMLGLDFHVTEPPELIEQLRVLGDRYARSVPGPESAGQI